MRRTKRNRGAALTELAVVVPLFLALVYGAIFLAELGIFKLQAQEVARYGAWAFTQRPLSNYEDERLRHTVAFTAAQSQVEYELELLYSDLDAATSSYGQSGVRGKLMAARLRDVSPSDLRNSQLSIVPDFANVDYVEPLSSLQMALTLLSVGTSVQSMVNGMINRLGFNTKGLVTARAEVELHPPTDDEDAQIAAQLASVGKVRGADLSRWEPEGRLRDTGGGRIEVTLLADSWRVTEGFSALPPRGSSDQAVQLENAVREVAENGINALPGGPLASILLSTLWVETHLPKELLTALGRTNDERWLRTGRVVARPYSAARSATPHKRDGHKQGQMNLYDYLDKEAPAGAVESFETAPLFVDPENPHASGYLEALQARGNNFLGCKEPERRGCFE